MSQSDFYVSSGFKFLVKSHLYFKDYVTTWVIQFFLQNLSLWISSQIFYDIFLSQQYFNIFSSYYSFPIHIFYFKFCSSQNSLAIASSFWTISSRFIRAIFFSRFPFTCAWPSLFTENISCLLSPSCLSRWYDWQ